jgi:hypothetical protein
MCRSGRGSWVIGYALALDESRLALAGVGQPRSWSRYGWPVIEMVRESEGLRAPRPAELRWSGADDLLAA